MIHTAQHASRRIAKHTLLLTGIALTLGACAMTPSEPDTATSSTSAACPTATKPAAQTSALCIQMRDAAGQWEGQLEPSTQSAHWSLSLRHTPAGGNAEAIASASRQFAPSTANSPAELIKPENFKWDGQRASIDFAWKPAQGGFDLISYRVVLALLENDWRVVSYATAYRNAEKGNFRVNHVDLLINRMYNCESAEAFICSDTSRFTPLVKQALPRLADWPGLLNYAPKPNVPVMVR